MQARVYEDGEDTHRVVCQACLALSSVDRAAQLQRHAQELRELAAAMDTEAEALPPMPSHAEWTAANAEAEAEYLRDLNPEERARLDAELEDWTHDQSAKTCPHAGRLSLATRWRSAPSPRSNNASWRNNLVDLNATQAAIRAGLQHKDGSADWRRELVKNL